MCQTSITFNSITRQFELWQDDEITAQYDYTQPDTAHQHHLQLSDPDTYNAARYLAVDLFRHNPDMQERIWSAAYIVARNGVRPPYYLRDPLDVFRVRERAPSLAPSTAYYYKPNPHLSITPHNDHLHPPPHNGRQHCPCFDYQNNPSIPKIDGHPMCIHILAVKIQKMIKRPLNTWPIDSTYTTNERARIMQDLNYIELHGMPPESLLIIQKVRRQAQQRIADLAQDPTEATEFIKRWRATNGRLQQVEAAAIRAEEKKAKKETSTFVEVQPTWADLFPVSQEVQR